MTIVLLGLLGMVAQAEVGEEALHRRQSTEAWTGIGNQLLLQRDPNREGMCQMEYSTVNCVQKRDVPSLRSHRRTFLRNE